MKRTDKKINRIMYDWLTFTSKIHSVPDLVQLLGLSDVPFENAKGRYCYADRLTYDGINIYFNGADDMGICVELSGQGCRNFETFGNGDYNSIFRLINENYDIKSDNRKMNITRLDVAYDDFMGLLDLDYLMKSVQLGDYVSRLKRAGCHWDNQQGCTVYHGSERQSSVYVRIYDKLVEQVKIRNKNIDPAIKHWVRCEIQMKDICAKGFISLGGDIRKNYFEVLNNYLRYVISSDDSNKRRLGISPQWLNFIESWESVSIFDKPGMQYNVLNLDNYVTNQLSGAIITYASTVGIDTFLQNIVDARKGKKLNPKYEKILKETQSSTDSILEYLELKKEMY